jgi:hypothetical protein
MAHFAKLDHNNRVIHVSVVRNEDILNASEVEDESVGIQFLTKIHNYDKWKQTSYNATFRKNYAGLGFIYDEERDAFIPPKPYESWSLNEETCRWEPPVPHPEDKKLYLWDEETQNWISDEQVEESE